MRERPLESREKTQIVYRSGWGHLINDPQTLLGKGEFQRSISWNAP